MNADYSRIAADECWGNCERRRSAPQRNSQYPEERIRENPAVNPCDPWFRCNSAVSHEVRGLCDELTAVLS
jgi:hypothetical protein